MSQTQNKYDGAELGDSHTVRRLNKLPEKIQNYNTDKTQ